MLQVRNSNRSVSPKNGLSVKRSVRLLVAVGLTVLCTVLFGCKGKEGPVDPFVTPGTTENPNWVITVDNNMTASMTVIAKAVIGTQPGTLAAFIGDECCGIANYNADLGLYLLYISPATEGENGQSPMTNVQLKFYSQELKRIYVATSTFPFSSDARLGSITEPYTPAWTAAQ